MSNSTGANDDANTSEDGTDIVNLPFSCPSWCTARHDIRDHPEDSTHRSIIHSVPMTGMPHVEWPIEGKPSYRPVEFMGELAQHYREAEPRILLADTDNKFTGELTLDEAEQLLVSLAVLVRQGRDVAGPEISRTEDAEGNVTMRIEREEYGELVLGSGEGMPTIVALWSVRDADLTLPQATTFALDILHLVATQDSV